VRTLSQLKFREKIGSSFGVLIALIIVNALVSGLAAGSIVHQFSIKHDLQQAISEVDRVRLIASGYVNTHSRESAQQVFFRLEATRRQLDRIAVTLDDAQLRAMPAQLDDFKLQFQKYMAEADQKAALQSRAVALGQRMVAQLGEVQVDPRELPDRALADNVRGHVQELQWAGFGMQANLLNASMDEQMAGLRSALAQLDQSSAAPSRNPQLQRLLFRVQRDARDYVASFESYLRYRARNQATEKELTDISDAIQGGFNQASASVGQVIQQRIYGASALMATIFLLSLLSALDGRNAAHCAGQPASPRAS